MLSQTYEDTKVNANMRIVEQCTVLLAVFSIPKTKILYMDKVFVYYMINILMNYNARRNHTSTQHNMVKHFSIVHITPNHGITTTRSLTMKKLLRGNSTSKDCIDIL